MEANITMTGSSKMEVIEICRVTPAPPEPNSPETTTPAMLPLTFFDLLWLRFSPVHRLFYYNLSPAESLAFSDSILPKLKLSLSLTLRRFLPLAGKISWRPDSERPVMIYEEGDAVSLKVAQSEAEFRRFSSSELCEATECYFLIPELEDSDEEVPVMALQVTYFPNSGFCIGITTHHAALDGKSSTSFMKAWAYICRTGEGTSLSPELNPFFDRTMIGDPAGLEELFIKTLLNQNGPNNKSLKYHRWEVPRNSIRGTFEISREKIEKLRALISSKESHALRLTTFALTCAYIWVCISKAEQNGEAEFIFAVDCRSLLSPAVPPSYVGNCVGGREVNAGTGVLLGENGVAMAAKSISQEILTLNEEYAIYEELKASMEWLSSKTSSKSRFISVAGSPRFEVYSTDFGWGNPRRVEMTSIDKSGAFCLSDSRNGNGGIQIGLVLSSATMAVFASLFNQGLREI